MVIAYSKSSINRVRLPILLVVSLAGKTNNSLSPFVPENLIRETVLAVPSRVNLLNSIPRLNLVLTYEIVTPDKCLFHDSNSYISNKFYVLVLLSN